MPAPAGLCLPHACSPRALPRLPQSGGWTVALEGRCRLRVRSVHLSSLPPQQHYEAGVEQLDYFAGPVAPASSAAVSPAAAKEQEELAQQLLKVRRGRGRVRITCRARPQFGACLLSLLCSMRVGTPRIRLPALLTRRLPLLPARRARAACLC
jgi:hypothetical protein